MSNRKGNKNEHRSMALFEAAGYWCMRSAASLSEWDFAAFGSKDLIVCQVKTRDWPGTVEMEALRNSVVPANCRKLVHRWRDYARTPDVKEL